MDGIERAVRGEGLADRITLRCELLRDQENGPGENVEVRTLDSITLAFARRSYAKYRRPMMELLADGRSAYAVRRDGRALVRRVDSTVAALEKGGILAGSVIRRAWRSARKAVLPQHVFEVPTGRRVYDNRHTRLTKWLNDGIPPAQVAEWAGNSVPVLLAPYARCVEGQLPDLKRRLEAAGDLPEPPDAG
ncbi:hypothetical protein [Streptomyces sp. T028]|uniref:hypothetical protein n=1 Tax=Streptomyces sp. T028 TaxID=3394379 RepID=UPI003A85C932